MAASFLGLAVQLPRDASDALESNEIVMLVVEEQPDEVMVGDHDSFCRDQMGGCAP